MIIAGSNFCSYRNNNFRHKFLQGSLYSTVVTVNIRFGTVDDCEKLGTADPIRAGISRTMVKVSVRVSFIRKTKELQFWSTQSLRTILF